jgi:hypothetical protein
MSHKRKMVFLAFGLGLVAILWLYMGVYDGTEWGEPHLFIKYRPSLKVHFYSPLGEATQSDIPGHEGYLSAEHQREEDAYVEFVEQHWLRR